jgi:hypothetical protein
VAIGKVKTGALHDDMGIPRSQPIPLSALMAKKAKDKREGNTKGERRDTFAINARRWNR